MSEREQWIFMFKASGLQSYIFSTNKLREVIGGSQLISYLTRNYLEEALQQLACEQGTDYEILQQTAGQATLRFFDESKARSLYAIWPLLVGQLAPGLEAHQWMARAGEAGLFATLQTGWDALRARRNTRQPTLPEVAPPVIRSPRNGGPAVQKYAANKHENAQYLDRAAVRKNTIIKSHPSIFVGLSPQDVRKDWARDEWGSTNDDIAPKSGDYMSVVHADGNRLGSFLTEMAQSIADKNLDDDQVAALYRDFSSGLAEVTRQAAINALQSIKTECIGESLPVRPVVIGGDDVTLMIRSTDALRVTTGFLRHFETLSKEMLAGLNREYELDVFTKDTGRAFSACAGIIYHRRQHPLLNAYENAEALCSWAKKKSRRPGGDTVSSVMFARLLDSTSTDLMARIDDDFRDERSNLYLSAGPYSANEVTGFISEKLLRNVCLSMNRVSHGALRGVVDDLQISGPRARRSFERLVMVNEGAGHELQAVISGVGDRLLSKRAGGEGPDPAETPGQFDARDAGLSILPDASILQFVEANHERTN